MGFALSASTKLLIQLKIRVIMQKQGGIKQELQENKNRLCFIFTLEKIDHANQIQAFKQEEARMKP